MRDTNTQETIAEQEKTERREHETNDTTKKVTADELGITVTEAVDAKTPQRPVRHIRK